MRPRTLFCLLVVAACNADVATTSRSAAPGAALDGGATPWKVTALPPPPEFSLDGFALSVVGANGDLAGTGSDGTYRQGILRLRDGRYVRLRALAGDLYSVPTAVSPDGRAAGYSVDSLFGGLPVVWSPTGVPRALSGFARGFHTIAALTAGGLVMGSTDKFDPPWQAAFSMHINDPTPTDRSPALRGINVLVVSGNERGEMVGATSANVVGWQSVYWRKGGPPVSVNPPAGHAMSQFVGINEAGQVLARAFNVSQPPQSGATWTVDGGYQLLQPPPGMTTVRAVGLDGRGRAYGQFGAGTTLLGHAIWERGIATVLPLAPVTGVPSGRMSSNGVIYASMRTNGVFTVYVWQRGD